MQAAEDARALAFSAKDRVSVAQTTLVQLGNARASEQDLIRAADQVERAQELQQQRYRHWQDAEGLVTRVQSWLNEQRHLTFEICACPSIALNGAPAHLVGVLRSQISRLAAEHRTIKLAPAPLDDAKRQVRDLVARLGATGKPVVHTQFGQLTVHGWESAEQKGPTFHDKTVATLCWLMPDVIIARLNEMLEQMPPTIGDVLPVQCERPAKLAEPERQVFDLECEEEATIIHAASQGIVIERRHEQSAQSILGVRIATATARAA